MQEPTKENIVYVDLVPSKRTNHIQLAVINCPYCRNRHNHGIGQGWRATHCYNRRTGESYSRQYYLKIDWTIPEHAKLKKRYEKLLGGVDD